MIALHRAPSGQDLLLNAEKIVAAFTNSTPGREGSVVKMDDGNGIYEVRESLAEIKREMGWIAASPEGLPK
jgi:hypothetical protein